MDNKFTFNNTSAVAGGTIANSVWHYSDGQTEIVNNPKHSFTAPDTYYVKLTVYSDKGCMNTSDSVSLIVYETPNAAFLIDDTSRCLRNNYFYFKDVSVANKVPIIYRKWDMGDGTAKSDTNTGYAYANDRIYNVKLTIKTIAGCDDSITRQLVVFAQPHAAFSTNDTIQCLDGNLFKYSNNSQINSDSMYYFWEFGDGDTSTSYHTTHHYSAIDTYTVRLTGTSNYGCIDSFK